MALAATHLLHVWSSGVSANPPSELQSVVVPHDDRVILCPKSTLPGKSQGVVVDVLSLSPADWPVTRTEAARELGDDVTPAMVSMWVIRGWTDDNGVHHDVTILGREGRSRLYRFGDLQQCEKYASRSPNSRRRASTAA